MGLLDQSQFFIPAAKAAGYNKVGTIWSGTDCTRGCCRTDEVKPRHLFHKRCLDQVYGHILCDLLRQFGVARVSLSRNDHFEGR